MSKPLNIGHEAEARPRGLTSCFAGGTVVYTAQRAVIIKYDVVKHNSCIHQRLFLIVRPTDVNEDAVDRSQSCQVQHPKNESTYGVFS